MKFFPLALKISHSIFSNSEAKVVFMHPSVLDAICCSAKIPKKSNGRSPFALSSILAERLRQWELEAASHTESAVRKKRDEFWCSPLTVLLIHSGLHTLKMVVPIVRVALQTSVHLYRWLLTGVSRGLFLNWFSVYPRWLDNHHVLFHQIPYSCYYRLCKHLLLWSEIIAWLWTTVLKSVNLFSKTCPVNIY